MTASTYHTLQFDGAMTERGFWLYVWRITPVSGEEVLYVGRTGDNPSPYASSPVQRMGTHFAKKSKADTMLRCLKQRSIAPGTSKFKMIAHGPLFLEGKDMSEHAKRRDKVQPLEKALAEALQCGGYKVMNQVSSKKHLDPDLWKGVSEAFAERFTKLCRSSDHKACRRQKA